jgi:membrane protease YdiL (CAAX protease family)
LSTPFEPTGTDGQDGLDDPAGERDESTRTESELPPVPQGPPGGRIFSLEGRPAPGLYLVAWLLSLIGVAALFVAVSAQPSTGKVLLGLGGVVSLGLGLATAAGYQLLARADRHPSRYRGPSPLILFGVVLAASTLGKAGLGPLGLGDPDQALGFLVAVGLIAVCYLATIWLFVVRGGALSWPDMGWPRRGTRWLAEGATAVVTAVAVMLPATLAILLFGALVARVLGVEAPDQLPVRHDSAEALMVALAVAVVAPIGEEAFFRGFAVSAWLRDLGPRSALLRGASFFAIVHILNVSVEEGKAAQGFGQAILEFAVILPLGLVLGWLFLRRGIVGSIAGHMTYNGLILALVAVRAVVPDIRL